MNTASSISLDPKKVMTAERIMREAYIGAKLKVYPLSAFHELSAEDEELILVLLQLQNCNKVMVNAFLVTESATVKWSGTIEELPRYREVEDGVYLFGKTKRAYLYVRAQLSNDWLRELDALVESVESILKKKTTLL